jgi:hypothetical protein
VSLMDERQIADAPPTCAGNEACLLPQRPFPPTPHRLVLIAGDNREGPVVRVLQAWDGPVMASYLYKRLARLATAFPGYTLALEHRGRYLVSSWVRYAVMVGGVAVATTVLATSSVLQSSKPPKKRKRRQRQKGVGVSGLDAKIAPIWGPADGLFRGLRPGECFPELPAKEAHPDF